MNRRMIQRTGGVITEENWDTVGQIVSLIGCCFEASLDRLSIDTENLSGPFFVPAALVIDMRYVPAFEFLQGHA